MTWRLHKFKSARIVSHRCSPLGGDHPDTSYRQCIVRLVSLQTLTTKAVPSPTEIKKTTRASPKWTPDSARSQKATKEADKDIASANEGEKQRVVEYLVMQTRVMEGKEEDWKIWGFATESTPESIEEDENYWRKMLDVQAAA